ncbi:serine hydrolase domain-containing protein [Algicella marina]|uniref:Serine hydrolase n=1 Tax=Algicella marina TaxID=2683284 RepID=A0A6P1T2S5_9RHOB|nr:serine hydrolase [Algicella marina]QHQ37018.1 serine hydrolase [Algicella marina]
MDQRSGIVWRILGRRALTMLSFSLGEHRLQGSMGKALLLGIGVLACCGFLAQRVAADERAEKLVALLLEESGAPGVAVAYLDGENTGLAAAGLRAKGKDAEATADDLWHIGSITKSMTAMIVARLAARGELSVKDSIGRVLGQHIKVHPEFADITYEELLTHRAGIADDIGPLKGFGLYGKVTERDLAADRLDLAATVLAKPPADVDFAYSNFGYVVAGAMLEATTGETWEALVTREVFTPLRLESAGFGAPGKAAAVDQPWGHSPGWFGRVAAAPPSAYADNPPAFGPAGTVHMTASDLLRYLTQHLQQPEDYLPVRWWDWLHTPPAGSYAMGWGVAGQVLSHDGSNTLWYARASFWPGKERALVLLANMGSDDALKPAFDTVEAAFRN